MKKYDVFIASPRHNSKWLRAATILDTDSRNVARAAAVRFSGYWIKVLPAIVIL